jgi:hypothetical protein
MSMMKLSEDNKNHHWTSYDEPTYHHSVKPVHADDDFALRPCVYSKFCHCSYFSVPKVI